MTAATAPLALPTEEEIFAAELACGDAIEKVEEVEHKLSKYLEAAWDSAGGDKDVGVTYETVGRLYAWLEHLRLDLGSLNDEKRALERHVDRACRLIDESGLVT